MGKKVYASGRMPADTAPTTNKPSKSPDNLPDRLEAMGVGKSTPLIRLQAANYISRFDDGALLAQYLGIQAEFKALTDYREDQAVEEAMAS